MKKPENRKSWKITMKAVILDGSENENSVAGTVRESLEKRGVGFLYFKLKEADIRPCRSCGSCGLRTPGRCVQKDDMPSILRAMAEHKLFVYITPVRFGGYSSQLKKAIDRTMPLGEPFYMVKNGHLLHPMRYGEKFILGIGLSETFSPDAEANFRLLVSRNAMNMQSNYQVLTIQPAGDPAALAKVLNGILGGMR
jgi:NAD(P)H-dependent FMN reductase